MKKQSKLPSVEFAPEFLPTTKNMKNVAVKESKESQDPAQMSYTTEKQEANSTLYQPPQYVVYLCLFVFFLVNFFEGIMMDLAQIQVKNEKNNDPWEGDWTNARVANVTIFLIGLPYLFDSIIRACVGLVFMQDIYEAFTPFKKLNAGQWLKLVGIRLMCHSGYILDTTAKVYTSASLVTVLNQLRIPLVAVLRYIFVKQRLNRNQKFFVYAIIFTALGWDSEKFVEEYQSEKNTLNGPFMFGLLINAISITFMAGVHVFMEDMMKDDFKEYGVWDKQFVFGLVDIPIMSVLLFVFIGLERGVSGVPRSWNPFVGANDKYVFLLTINNAVWGLISYCILNWADALWLNLASVLIAAAVWVFEVTCPGLSGKFTISKVFSILTLICVCFGYEFETNEQEELKKTRLETNEQEELKKVSLETKENKQLQTE